jgi:hypothetical protein
MILPRVFFNLDQKVKMIFHESIGIKMERVSTLVVRKIGKECLEILDLCVLIFSPNLVNSY